MNFEEILPSLKTICEFQNLGTTSKQLIRNDIDDLQTIRRKRAIQSRLSKMGLNKLRFF